MQNSEYIQVLNASTEEHFNHIRSLIREFLKWHRDRHLEDIELINEYFDSTVFEDELSLLPGKYSTSKGGALLLALYKEQPSGCVALRKIDAANCEMKRMFVYPSLHGKGIGHTLTEAILNEARTIGYSYMKLDTSFRQIEAIKLYQDHGFKQTPPYYPVSETQRNWLVFMSLKL